MASESTLRMSYEHGPVTVLSRAQVIGDSRNCQLAEQERMAAAAFLTDVDAVEAENRADPRAARVEKPKQRSRSQLQQAVEVRLGECLHQDFEVRLGDRT